MIFNRTGSGEVLLFIVLASLMALTLIGIGLGLVAFFGEGYDFRTAESEVLSYRIQQCLRNTDMFDVDFKVEDCGLDSRVLNEEHIIYLERDDKKTFIHGVASYRESCFFNAAKNKLRYPQCIEFTALSQGKKVTGIVGSAQVARIVD